MRPDETDALEPVEGEPEGWHVRETTEEGYPLMGSSPAERAEQRELVARIRREAMRDHPFKGDGPYCRAWNSPQTSGGPETGVVTMRTGCGYPVDLHPEALTTPTGAIVNRHALETYNDAYRVGGDRASAIGLLHIQAEREDATVDHDPTCLVARFPVVADDVFPWCTCRVPFGWMKRSPYDN